MRRRAVRLTVRPSEPHARMTISSRPSFRNSTSAPEEEEEDELSYEEIPVDENSPVHYDKNVRINLDTKKKFFFFSISIFVIKLPLTK